MRSANSDAYVTARFVEELEAHGLGRNDYCLHDEINTDIPLMVAKEDTPDTEVRFSVEGFQVTVTGEGKVTVKDTSRAGSRTR